MPFISDATFGDGWVVSKFLSLRGAFEGSAAIQASYVQLETLGGRRLPLSFSGKRESSLCATKPQVVHMGCSWIADQVRDGIEGEFIEKHRLCDLSSEGVDIQASF